MSIEQFIDNELKGNDVVLFMKGTPQFPMCGFSGQVVQILDQQRALIRVIETGEQAPYSLDKISADPIN